LLLDGIASRKRLMIGEVLRETKKQKETQRITRTPNAIPIEANYGTILIMLCNPKLQTPNAFSKNQSQPPSTCCGLLSYDTS
jgi:hypothetical protein